MRHAAEPTPDVPKPADGLLEANGTRHAFRASLAFPIVVGILALPSLGW
jgi:hypothetical protein